MAAADNSMGDVGPGDMEFLAAAAVVATADEDVVVALSDAIKLSKSRKNLFAHIFTSSVATSAGDFVCNCLRRRLSVDEDGDVVVDKEPDVSGDDDADEYGNDAGAPVSCSCLPCSRLEEGIKVNFGGGFASHGNSFLVVISITLVSLSFCWLALLVVVVTLALEGNLLLPTTFVVVVVVKAVPV